MADTIKIRQTSPVANMKREKLMRAINELSDTELMNLDTLLGSKKARGYLSSNVKFAGLKMMI
ncbi:hypothetical protein [Robiginitalea biformata]|uniref:Uncharacterized protein n=1 Tax=Robiginitalea biformata (strain ATCC BAA-864 / DSM 15991 / KCTC 12146 / HTCC2501) TaxID=313596 RepID=A4CKN7_ROBBH|nr:hypothetical protein [Robiginitalea biformata]EAR15436.1 hypothetical protein RB2501_13949 [Robiginitalea biformata HTCC2501]